MPFLMLISSILLNIIPVNIIKNLSVIIGNLWYLISKRKKFVRKNVKMIFGENDERIVKRVFINFIFSYLFLLKLPFLKKETFLRLFPKDIEERYLKGIDKNKGYILIGAHLGAWELAGPLLAALGYKIISVAESKGPGERFFRFYLRYRERFGAKILRLEQKDIVEKILRYYKGGFLIGLISDRDITKTGRIINFLNGKVSLPVGPSIISYRLKSKILTGFIIVENFNFKIVTYPIIHSEYLDVEEIFNTIKSFLEEAIKKYPDNWFVFEEIWR